MMEPEDALAKSIGLRVRSLRQQRGWTLDDLAARAAVSRRMLVTIEQGGANVSVATLARLGTALGVTVGRLVDTADVSPIQVRRSGEGSVLWRGPEGGAGTVVSTTPPPYVVALWDWVMEGGEAHESAPHALGTRELLLMIEGALDLSLGTDIVHLQAGDSAAFGGDEIHAYRNPGSRRARFALVVFEPDVERTAR